MNKMSQMPDEEFEAKLSAYGLDPQRFRSVVEGEGEGDANAQEQLKSLTPEEQQRFMEFMQEEFNIDFKRMMFWGQIFWTLVTAGIGFCAGYLLQSQKHLLIIVGINFALGLLSGLSNLGQAALPLLWNTAVTFAAGYWAIGFARTRAKEAEVIDV